MSIWREFFQDDTNRGSMTRLLCFLAFWPASYVVVVDPEPGIYSWFVSAFVLQYVGGKTADAIGGKLKKPTTIINQKPGGDINVDSGAAKIGKKKS